MCGVSWVVGGWDDLCQNDPIKPFVLQTIPALFLQLTMACTNHAAFATAPTTHSGHTATSVVCDAAAPKRSRVESPAIPQLGAWWHVDALWQLLQQHQVVAVRGETGCGKSTALPTGLL